MVTGLGGDFMKTRHPFVSREGAKARRVRESELGGFAPSREPLNVEEVAAVVVGRGFRLHVEAGPGMRDFGLANSFGYE